MVWRAHREGTLLLLPSTACGKSVSHGMTLLCRHVSSLGSSTTRDKQRAQPGADTNSGNQTIILEPPDLTPHLHFNMNVLEHVAIPDVDMQKRRSTEMEKDKDMRARFGPRGPGEMIEQSPQQVRREMLQQQQDLDGLPWEVRWKKTLIPTSEEIVQDVKDRFALFEQDPMDREQEWYLHWKDRAFRIQRDRRIWPQGYTDYLDHYDEQGRRRVLPSDSRWSDTSWRYLADVHYKDRMWLLEGEGRKAAQASLRSWEDVLQEEDNRQGDMGDTLHGLLSGVVDLDPDQTYQALSGTANPVEVEKTKMRVQSYAAEQMIKKTQFNMIEDGTATTTAAAAAAAAGASNTDNNNDNAGNNNHDRCDDVMDDEDEDARKRRSLRQICDARMNKGTSRLASGVTVEQAAFIVGKSAMENEKLEQLAESARQSGRDPTWAYMNACTAASVACGSQPVLRAHADSCVRALRAESVLPVTNTLLTDRSAISSHSNNRNNLIDTGKDDHQNRLGSTTSGSECTISSNTNNNDNSDSNNISDKSAASGSVQCTSTTVLRDIARHVDRAVGDSSANSEKSYVSAKQQPSSRFIAGVVSQSSNTDKKDGFIPIPPRPPGADALHLFTEMYSPPPMATQDPCDAMPAWYRAMLVETEPPILHYGMTNDPLEVQSSASHYLTPPPIAPEQRITHDDATAGVSAFDHVKLHKLRTLPEVVDGYQPLPLYREVSGEHKDGTDESERTTSTTNMTATPNSNSDDANVSGFGNRDKESDACSLNNSHTATGTCGTHVTKLDNFGSSSSSNIHTKSNDKKSARVRQSRLERARLKHDPDILLPALPWEVDSIVDPYRGVAREDAEDFDKTNLEQTWQTYRGVFRQALTEFANLSQVTTEEHCERLLRDTMTRFRHGHVGQHPAIPESQEVIFRRIFEAHTKHFLGDFYKQRGHRYAESQALKSEGDDMLRQASAEAKQQGPQFMSFVQEVTSRELDSMRQNPVQRYAILLPNKHYEQLLQPMMQWMSEMLQSYMRKGTLDNPHALDLHREFAERQLNQSRLRCPARMPSVTDAARDAAVESCYQWCRGALCFHTGRLLADIMLHCADTRLRSRAELYYENSIEHFNNYSRIGRGVVHIPIPQAEPLYVYRESDFIDGESAVQAELSGELDKAESIWHSGSRKRWYPLLDETEYMFFLERRGRLTLALEVSERCLGHLHTKTHPSLHPFPERARVFLEGAPAAQETVEHLWMRHMGEVCVEHAAMMERQGQFERARHCRERGVGFYALALRSAQERRLPLSWRAPLLTRARYLMSAYSPESQRIECDDAQNSQHYVSNRDDSSNSVNDDKTNDTNSTHGNNGSRENTIDAKGTDNDKSIARAHENATASRSTLTDIGYAIKDGKDALRTHLMAVANVVDALFAMPEPAHWRDEATDLPIRLALIQHNLPVFGECITHMAVQSLLGATHDTNQNSVSNTDADASNNNSNDGKSCRGQPQSIDHSAAMRTRIPCRELLTAHMRQLAEGGPELAEVQPYLQAIHTAAEQIFRQPILRWRSRERKDSDEYFYWTYLYFNFHVRPQSESEVTYLYNLFKPAYENIYTNCALASPTRGQRLIHSALRYLCHILLPGSAAHKQTLLRILLQVRDKMSHMADKTELTRTIVALEGHLKDASQPTYVYSSALLYEEALRHEKIARNPLYRSALAAREYAAMREREQRVRLHANSVSPPNAQQPGGDGNADMSLTGQGEEYGGDELDSRGTGSTSSTRAMFSV